MLLSEQRWPVLPFGSDAGIATEGDAIPRVTQTLDGTDLNAVWNIMTQALLMWNEKRSALSALLTYSHTNASDAIPQSQNLSGIFKEATEFGEPESIRPAKYLRLGYTLEHYDTASRFSWRALMAMSEEQVLSSHNLAIAADEYMVNKLILQRLFDPTPTANENETPVYPLYNGDGMTPPPYQGKDFLGSHTHYSTSGNTDVDSGDVELLAKSVAEHGYNSDPSAQLLLLVNPAQAEQISTFRAGEVSANGIIAQHSFVPSDGTPAFYAPNVILGQRAPEKIAGLKIAGSYGPLWIVPLDDIPEDYMLCVSTYGNNSLNNVVGFREHPVPLYQGLRILPGPIPGYPVQESFYTHAYGLGVRRRGQAAVMQIKTSGSYDIPVVLFA